MIGNNNFSGQQTGPSLALPTRTCPVLAGQLILQSARIHRQVFGFDNTVNECVIIGADYAASAAHGLDSAVGISPFFGHVNFLDTSIFWTPQFFGHFRESST
jgi:hypothetical protein